MRYTEPKPRSAELLRLALAQMGRHHACFNPISFAVWYEHVASINPSLSQALDALVEQGAPVDDEAVMALYRAHVAAPDGEAVDRIGGELQRLMNKVSQTAHQAGSHAGDFSERLLGFSAALESNDSAALGSHVGEMLAGTAQMTQSVQALQEQVSRSQSEINRLRADLQRTRCEALLDPLTGILNRKGFDLRLAELIASRPAGDARHCLVMLDIDHFKRVNDTHGHVVGDRVIQGLGEVLRGTVTDPAHATARYGGEEFAIIVPHTTLDGCMAVAEKVRARTKAMKFRNRSTQDVILSITISGGVTAMREDDDADSLVARADAALYAAKHGGRDRVSFA